MPSRPPPPDWPHREFSRSIRSGEIDWHVQVAGRGPTVLLLHGTGSSTYSTPISAGTRRVSPSTASPVRGEKAMLGAPLSWKPSPTVPTTAVTNRSLIISHD